MKKIFILLCVTLLSFPANVFANDLAPESKSAILLDTTTGTVMYEKNANARYAPASMTKIMSMLLYLEYIESGGMEWDEVLTISANAASMGGSQIFLKENEKMSVSDLFKAVAMASANDASVALAERVAGSEAEFVKMMNERAKELNMNNTNFKNSTGLDAANQYSTAKDMALLAKEIVKHDILFEYTGIYEDYLRNDTENRFWLVNTNKIVC